MKLKILTLLISGLVLMSLSTIIFTVLVPMYDNKINENQDNINLYYFNSQNYDINENTAYLSWRLLTILKKMGLNQADLDYTDLYKDVLTLQIKSLTKLELMYSNQA